MNRYKAAILECGESPRYGLARCPDELANLLVREREAAARARVALLALIAPLKQQACKLLRRRRRQTNGAQLLASRLVLQAQLFGHSLISLRVTAQETEEGAPLDDSDS